MGKDEGRLGYCKLLEEQDIVLEGTTRPSGAMGTEGQVGHVQEGENM